MSGTSSGALRYSLSLAISGQLGSDSFAIAFLYVGAVEILVNCAGTSVAREFELSTGEDFEHMFRTNVLGTL